MKERNNVLEISIKEKLSDGKSHTFSELFEDIVLEFPEMKIDRKKISNTLYRMQKQIPELDMIKKGVYIMRDMRNSVLEKERNSIKIANELKDSCSKKQRELSEKPFEKYESSTEWMDAKCLYELLGEIVTLIKKREEEWSRICREI